MATVEDEMTSGRGDFKEDQCNVAGEAPLGLL